MNTPTRTDIVHYYFEKYIGNNEYLCNGPNYIPNNFQEVYEMLDKIGDNWDHQIVCVLCGHKKVAMTDYNQFDSEEELEDYYSMTPKDKDMRNFALKNGISILYSKMGTEFYFREENKRNAEILINYYDGIENMGPIDIDQSIGYTVTQALLLGYNISSIILYEIYNHLMGIIYQKYQTLTDFSIIDIEDKNLYEIYYQQLLISYKEQLYPIIEKCKTWIKIKNGNVY